MKILGYIVTSRKLNNIEGFVSQVSSIDDADLTKPVLIVGWQNAKEYDGYKSILEKKLGENLYWTFSRSESRSEFEEDLTKFYQFVIKSLADEIEYVYLDLFTLTYEKAKKVIEYANSRDFKTIYISGDMLYLPIDVNKIYGISLAVLEYCKIDKNKVLDLFKRNRSNRIIYDNHRDTIKLSRILGNKKYAMPYFI